MSTQLAESEFAAQARVHASTLGQNLQTGVRGAADQFNKFVEGDERSGDGRRNNRVEPERREFWDDFASMGDQDTSNHRRSASQRSQRSDVVGTAAMRKGPTASSLANSTPGMSGADAGEGKNTTTSTTAKAKDEWDDNW
jgi:ADP-ribosylation factor GTPase-activating protein 1